MPINNITLDNIAAFRNQHGISLDDVEYFGPCSVWTKGTQGLEIKCNNPITGFQYEKFVPDYVPKPSPLPHRNVLVHADEALGELGLIVTDATYRTLLPFIFGYEITGNMYKRKPATEESPATQ